MLSKKCVDCGIDQPITGFYTHKAMSDGHLNKCKTCVKARVGRHRSENLDRIRAYDRERAKHPERLRSMAAHTKAWRSADKRRTAAHNAVARAILAGRLDRQPCEWCGRIDSYAHHESYDNPLDVTWLCQPCHKQRHKEMVLAEIEP